MSYAQVDVPSNRDSGSKAVKRGRQPGPIADHLLTIPALIDAAIARIHSEDPSKTERAAQKELGERMLVDQSTISNYLRRKRRPAPDSWDLFAEAVGVSPETVRIAHKNTKLDRGPSKDVQLKECRDRIKSLQAEVRRLRSRLGEHG
jgi:transcriptional regulator with XRE-family HTH domain